MKTQSFRAAVSVLAAVFLCGAARSQAAEREPQAEAAGSLSASIAVSRDRDIAARFSNAREALDQQNYASGLGLLQTLLESNYADFVPIEPDPRDLTRERYASVSHAARRLLISLPAEALQLYEQQTGPTAWNEFEAASRRGDLDAVRRVSARFPLTRAELSALKFVVASALGSGRPQLAAAGAWQLLQHPLLEQRDRPRVELQLKAALRAQEVAKTGHCNSTLSPDIAEPWRVGGLIAADDATLLSEAFQEHESHSIDILPRGKPIIRGDVLCVRSLRHVSAYDLSSGRELWTSRKATDDAPVMTSNLSLRDLVARSLGKQVQSDSVLAGLNADAEIVVTVEAVQPRLVVLPSEPVVSGSTRIPQKTVLQARRLIDGRAAWTFNGAALIPHRPAPAGADFLGVPTFVDGELWGLAQCDSALLAYRLNRNDGRLLGVLKVGETTRGHIVDSDWRSLASQVQTASGELIFVTNAGLLLAVDPVSGTPLWATRYAREDAPPEYPQLVGAQINTSRRRWWDHWREGRVLPFGSADNAAQERAGFIVASTDCDDVTAFDHDGRLIWRQNIAEGVSVAGIRGDRLLVLTRHAALILNAATGTRLHTLPIPAPTGDGDWSSANSDAYWFPTARGIWSIEVGKSSALAKAVDGEGLAPGHLVAGRNGLVHQTVESVALISAGVRLPNDAKSPPGDPSENVDKLFAAAVRVEASGDAETAFKTYLRLLELNPTNWKIAEEIGPRRRVRMDRLVLGEMQDLLHSEQPAGTTRARTPLRDLITAAHQQATISPDPFALQRFAQRYGQLSPARDVWLHRSSRIGLGYVPALLPLLPLTEADDSLLGLRAAIEVAEHFRSRSYEDDARAILAKVPQLPTAEQTAESTSTLDAVLQLRRALSSEAKSFWPTTAPVVTEREMAQNNIAFKSLPVTAAAGSLLSRLDVSWHAAGTSLRFIGDGRAGGWSLTLPQTRAFMRRADRLARGWGVGHLLVAQLGTELFAVAPFDENGDARARLLWSVDMAPAAQMHGHRVIPARLGFADQDLQLFDAYDRPIGQVGPVQAGYLCYQAEGRLVCLETSSGQTLWERFELPHNATITGNEASIFVTADDSTTVLRALDGKTLRAPQPAEHSESRFVDQSGPWQVRQADDRLLGIDLRTGEVAWTLAADTGDLPFGADEDCLGLLSANGELTFLRRASGEPISQTPAGDPVRVSRPQRVEFLACVRVGSRYLVAISGPRSHASAETQFEALMTRNPLIDGTLTAFDSKTGKIQWTQEIAEGAFLLDQPRSVPFVMLQSTSVERGGTFLRLIDQRSGAELFRRHTPGREGLPLIRPNAPQPSVNLRSATREVIIDYAP